MTLSFEDLNEDEIDGILQRQESVRLFVRAFDLEPREGSPLLESIDRAFVTYLREQSGDADEVNHVVQVVGAAFGAALVEDLGFEWVRATDAFGSDLAVRALPGRGDVTIFPFDFVLKRYERKEAPFLVHAMEQIGLQLRQITDEWTQT